MASDRLYRYPPTREPVGKSSTQLVELDSVMRVSLPNEFASEFLVAKVCGEFLVPNCHYFENNWWPNWYRLKHRIVHVVKNSLDAVYWVIDLP